MPSKAGAESAWSRPPNTGGSPAAGAMDGRGTINFDHYGHAGSGWLPGAHPPPGPFFTTSHRRDPLPDAAVPELLRVAFRLWRDEYMDQRAARAEAADACGESLPGRAISRTLARCTHM
ncbi:unnamed protein product [Symbiodinium microadriaticum]|nr:unnamed protein product [Symbiodinium microadriaticum]